MAREFWAAACSITPPLRNSTDCTLSGNTAGTKGGGIYNGYFGSGGPATLDLTECTISGNSAAQLGGGLFNYATARLIDTIVAGNTRSSVASDIHEDASSTISGNDNLAGSDSAGVLADGGGQNIVVTGLSSLGLAPLGPTAGRPRPWHSCPAVRPSARAAR